MEHVAYFMNENVKYIIEEQKFIKNYYDELNCTNLWMVYKRNIFYAFHLCEDIDYVKEKQKELQILLCVCKDARLLIGICNN
jgi:hypothetical protein